MPPDCDPATATCAEPWSAPDTVYEAENFSPAIPKKIPLDVYETANRMEGGEQVIRSFPLPWGQAGLFRVPLLGEVFLHVDRSARIETVEPIRIGPGGIIRSGILKFHGNVGLTFRKKYERGGVPLLYRFDTIRFHNGDILVKMVNMAEALDETSQHSTGDSGESLGGLHLVLYMALRHFMGKPNERGEFNLQNFIDKRGLTFYFRRLQVSRLLEFLRRKTELGSAVVSSLAPPDYHLTDTHGHVAFKNPILADPQTGDVVKVGRIVNEVHPLPSSKPEPWDAVRLGFEYVTYENPYRGMSADISGLEFAIRDDFDYRDPLHFAGSGEIRWDRISFHGAGVTGLSLGCVSKSCQKPQRIRFSFMMKPDGLSVKLDNTANEIYTDEKKVVGVVTQALLDLYFNFEKGKPVVVSAGGAMRVSAVTQSPLNLAQSLSARGGGTCDLTAESPDVTKGGVSGTFMCMVPLSGVEWSNEDGRSAMDLTLSEGKMDGEFESGPRGSMVCIDRWEGQINLSAPLIVKAMELVARTTGKKPVAKKACVEIRPDGTKVFTIEVFTARVGSGLRSPFFGQSAQSLMKVVRLRATLRPDGHLFVEPEDPKKTPIFLTARAKGEVRLQDGFRFPFVDGKLSISRIDYDYAMQRAVIEGHLEFRHDSVPEEYLKRFPVTIRSHSGRPQTFRVAVRLDNWALTRRGVVEIFNGRMDVEALDTVVAPKPAKTASPPAVPQMLHAVVSALPEKKVKGAGLFDGVLFSSVASAFFSAIARINRLEVSAPENPGEPEISLLGRGLTLSLRFPAGSAWEVELETRTHPETGRESVARFVLRPREPARVCLNLFGQCVTQADFLFKKIELVTIDPPPPDYDVLTGASTGPAGRPAGEVILHWGTIQPPLVKMVMDSLGVDEATAEKFGVKIEKDRWRIPLDLAKLQELFRAVTATAEKAGPSGLFSRVLRPPSIRWGDAKGFVDLVLRGGRHWLNVDSGGLPLRILLDTEHDSRLVVSRKSAREPFRIGRFRLPLVGVERASFYAFVRGLTLDDTLFDPVRGTVRSRIGIDDIPFKVGRTDGEYWWRGRVSGIKAVNLSVDRTMERDPLDLQQRLVPVLRIGTDRLDYRFIFQKEGRMTGVFPVRFEGTPHYQNPSLKIYPNRIEIAYDLASDSMTLDGPHFMLKGLEYTARRAFMTTQITDDIVGGDVWVSVPELEIRGGEIWLGSGKAVVAGQSTARGTTVAVRDEKAEFSSEWIDVVLQGVSKAFMERLDMPQGLSIEEFDLAPVKLAGVVSKGSSAFRGNLDLSGRLEVTASGRMALRYDDSGLQIRRFESPIALRIGKLNRLKTDDGKMTLLDFEDMEIDFRDMDAVINLFGFLRTHLSAFPDIDPAKIPRTSHGILRIKKGRVEISGNGNGTKPKIMLRFEGMGFDVSGYSGDTAMEFRYAGRGARINYPYLSLSVGAENGILSAVMENGAWRPDVTVGPLKATVTVRRTRIGTR